MWRLCCCGWGQGGQRPTCSQPPLSRYSRGRPHPTHPLEAPSSLLAPPPGSTTRAPSPSSPPLAAGGDMADGGRGGGGRGGKGKGRGQGEQLPAGSGAWSRMMNLLMQLRKVGFLAACGCGMRLMLNGGERLTRIRGPASPSHYHHPGQPAPPPPPFCLRRSGLQPPIPVQHPHSCRFRPRRCATTRTSSTLTRSPTLMA